MKKEVQTTQSAVSADIALEKISFREKFQLSLVHIGVSPILLTVTGFLMIFYTDIVGLNPIDIGILFLIARIMDGVSDPLMGFLLDRMPRLKMGKFRYLLVVGAVLCSLNFLVMWYGPLWATAGKLVIAYVTYLLLGFTYDIMDISKNSLLPSMTSNLHERNKLGAVSAFGGLFGAMLFTIGIPIVLGNNADISRYSIVILMCVGVVVFLSSIGVAGIKERVTPAHDEKKYSIRDYVKILLNKPVYILLIFNILFAIGQYLIGAVNAYFFKYVIPDYTLLGVVGLVQMVGILPGIFLAGTIFKKFGKKKSLVVSIAILIVFTLIRLIDPVNVPLVFVSTFVLGFVLGLYMTIINIMTADNIDYVEYKMKIRSEAAQTSANSFVSKVGSGIAGAMPGIALGLAGYIPNSAIQPDGVASSLIVLTIVVPAVLYGLSILVFGFGYKLDKKTLEDVETTLSEARASKHAAKFQKSPDK